LFFLGAGILLLRVALLPLGNVLGLVGGGYNANGGYPKTGSLFVDELKSSVFDGGIVLWRKEGIDDYLQHLIDHERQHLFYVVVGHTQVGIVVHFQKPGSKVLIHQKVISE
jgi:hypothetical protein